MKSISLGKSTKSFKCDIAIKAKICEINKIKKKLEKQEHK